MSIKLLEFKRDLIYRDRVSPRDLPASIELIRKWDQKAKRIAPGNWKFALIPLGIFSVWTLLFLISGAPQTFAHRRSMIVAIGMIAVTIGFSLYLLFYKLVFQKYNFSNRRYELVEELAKILQRDMSSKAKITLMLDLSAPMSSSKLLSKGSVGSWKVKYFEDPWLRLQGSFLDGTDFEIRLIDRHQLRWKYTGGKNKYKSKTKEATLFSVQLSPTPERYPDVANQSNQALNLMKLPEWVRVKKVLVKKNELSVVAAAAANWSVRSVDSSTPHNAAEVIVRMLLSLYQVLHLSKTVLNRGI